MPGIIALIAIACFTFAATLGAPAARAESLAAQCARNAGGGDVETCRRALAEQPGDLDLRRLLAHSLTIDSNYPAAIQIYQDIVKERPNDPRAHYDLAGLFGTIRRYEEAVAPIEAAIRLRPDNILAYQAAAVIYAQTGRLKESVAITNRAAELGDTASMYEMSLYLQDGVGVPASDEKAFYWTRRAAEGNHVAAMQLMSEIYLEGLLGQPRDQKKFFEWARRARAQRRWPGK